MANPQFNDSARGGAVFHGSELAAGLKADEEVAGATQVVEELNTRKQPITVGVAQGEWYQVRPAAVVKVCRLIAWINPSSISHHSKSSIAPVVTI